MFNSRIRSKARRPASTLLVLLILTFAVLSQAPTRAQDAPRVPTLWLIGDSTVNNRTAGQLGWGDPFATLFDPAKVRVVNRARGGRSSRTFFTEGLWDAVLTEMKPGDFVLMQFGHNDGGSLTGNRGRASLKGNGEETQDVTDPQSGKMETVHTYGWYLRRYISDAKAKGATPIVLSLVPRNIWKDGHVARGSSDYGKWAAEAARAAAAPFIDLNEIVARHYEEAGQEKVASEYFGPTDHTHTTPAGALLNAQSVLEGLRTLKDVPLAGFAKVSYRFDFGPGKAAPGYVPVSAETSYSHERGYGFEPGAAVSGVGRGGDPKQDGFCTSGQPFFFSVDVPEGNYRVTLRLGDPGGEAEATVKAEARRLMLEDVSTRVGQVATRSFAVNVRNSRLPSGEVRLNARERESFTWDDRLTLELNGARPCLCSLEIEPAQAVTIFVAGDSTVTDQAREPWNSWGQMLTRFFGPGVAVANHAESGRALRSFKAERRLEKVLSQIRPGDYLLIQFGHNDQKEKGEGVGAFTTFRASLQEYVAEARKRGALPVLVTSMHRRRFDEAGHVVQSLGDYPEAVRQVAREKEVPLIDLNAMSQPLYEAWGVEGSKKAFVDTTHHNTYGSYELARCVVEGIRKAVPQLAKHLVPDAVPFDPTHPDPVAAFRIPPSPQRDPTAPEGS